MKVNTHTIDCEERGCASRLSMRCTIELPPDGWRCPEHVAELGYIVKTYPVGKPFFRPAGYDEHAVDVLMVGSSTVAVVWAGARRRGAARRADQCTCEEPGLTIAGDVAHWLGCPKARRG